MAFGGDRRIWSLGASEKTDPARCEQGMKCHPMAAGHISLQDARPNPNVESRVDGFPETSPGLALGRKMPEMS
jgi:hypothetical protein